MTERVLLTGGAGFIGSHIVDALLEAGHEVRALDNLDPQVHGPDAKKPDYLSDDAEFIQGDILDTDTLKKALAGVSVIFHEAAAVGVGQSMYHIARYTRTNCQGTANLLDVIVNQSSLRDNLRKIIVASSMSIYGEGKCYHPSVGEFMPFMRSPAQIARGQWEILTESGEVCEPRPTDENQPPDPTSIYAIHKLNHEQSVLVTGQTYNIPAVALRYFNVYGPRQSLSNPYTGVAAIFSSRILNGQPPLIYEDGRQSRDYIHVSDIARANLLAMQNDAADYQVFNVGNGRPVTILEMAQTLIRQMGMENLAPEIVGRFRAGDIRHCYADISKIKSMLGFAPQVSFEEGTRQLVESIRGQSAQDNVSQAFRELEQRGLTF